MQTSSPSPFLSVEGSTVTSYPPIQQRDQTLSSLCLWWGRTKKEALPDFCHRFLPVPPDKLEELLSSPFPPRSGTFSSVRHSDLHTRRPVHRDRVTQEVNPIASTRRISLVGILGGVLFILLLIAFVTCIRQHKIYQEQEGPPNTVMSHHLRYVRQMRASQDLMDQLSHNQQTGDIPPNYSFVVKLKEEEEKELPSYSQAVAGGSSACKGQISQTTEDAMEPSQIEGEISQMKEDRNQTREETSQIQEDTNEGETNQTRRTSEGEVVVNQEAAFEI